MNFGALNIQDPNIWQQQQNLMPQGLPMAMPQPIQAPQPMMMPQAMPRQPMPMQQMPQPLQQPVQQQNPQILAGPANPSPHGPFGDVLNQMFVTGQQQDAQGPALAQKILSMRFEPNQADNINANVQNNLSLLAPNSFKTTTPFEQAQQRTTMQLAPYTTSLDLATKQAGLQEAQVKSQYAQPLMDAEIKLKNAQAYMAGGGMFSQGAAGGGPSGAPQLNGQAYLQTLPPQIATQVKALAEGRMQFPGGFALKSPYWQQMISAVSTYDPNFDAVNYNARAKTRNDFTSGKSAAAIQALNTVAGHLANLEQSSTALNNTGGFPGATTFNNMMNSAYSGAGDPRLKTFNTDKQAVSNELAKAYRGGVITDSEAKSWNDTLSSANSPEQFHAVLGELSDLLESKINAINDTYNQGMGTTSQPLDMVRPRARATFDRLEKYKMGPMASPAQSSSGGQSSNIPPALLEEAKRRGIQ